MHKLTIAYGVILMALGLGTYFATGSQFPTSLIPLYAGVLFVLFGVLANSENVKRRMLWMHVAVTVALLLFLGMIPSIIKVFKLAAGAILPRPVAIEEQAALGLFSLLFVMFCVRSFIAARRARTAV